MLTVQKVLIITIDIILLLLLRKEQTMMRIYTLAARPIFLESGEKVNISIPRITLIKAKLGGTKAHT